MRIQTSMRGLFFMFSRGSRCLEHSDVRSLFFSPFQYLCVFRLPPVASVQFSTHALIIISPALFLVCKPSKQSTWRPVRISLHCVLPTFWLWSSSGLSHSFASRFESLTLVFIDSCQFCCLHHSCNPVRRGTSGEGSDRLVGRSCWSFGEWRDR